jgi:adenylate cyclase
MCFASLGAALGIPVHAFSGAPLAIAAIHGALITVLCLAYEDGLYARRLKRAIGGLPGWRRLGAAYLVLMLLVALGVGLAALLSAPLRGVGSAPTLSNATIFSLSALIVLPISVLLHCRHLLGSQVFSALLLGTYATPRLESRVLLSIDMADSTAIAERLGLVESQKLIAAFLFALGEPVSRHRGSIDKYMGDQAMISWIVKPGRRAPALACAEAIETALRTQRTRWLGAFGVAPGFRIVIHAGTVVVAEVGDARREISYFGDPVNTLSRMDASSRDGGHRVLISADALAQVEHTPTAQLQPLGAIRLRGRVATLDLYGCVFAPEHSAARD